jgi:hypothetical protein
MKIRVNGTIGEVELEGTIDEMEYMKREQKEIDALMARFLGV